MGMFVQQGLADKGLAWMILQGLFWQSPEVLTEPRGFWAQISCPGGLSQGAYIRKNTDYWVSRGFGPLAGMFPDILTVVPMLMVSVNAHGCSLQHDCVPWFSGTEATGSICPGPFPLISRGCTVRMLNCLADGARWLFLICDDASFTGPSGSRKPAGITGGLSVSSSGKHLTCCLAKVPWGVVPGGLYGFMWSFTCNPFRMLRRFRFQAVANILLAAWPRFPGGVVPGGVHWVMWGFTCTPFRITCGGFGFKHCRHLKCSLAEVSNFLIRRARGGVVSSGPAARGSGGFETGRAVVPQHL